MKRAGFVLLPLFTLSRCASPLIPQEGLHKSVSALYCIPPNNCPNLVVQRIGQEKKAHSVLPTSLCLLGVLRLLLWMHSWQKPLFCPLYCCPLEHQSLHFSQIYLHRKTLAWNNILLNHLKKLWAKSNFCWCQDEKQLFALKSTFFVTPITSYCN